MLLTKEVEININGQNQKYYEDKGYQIPRKPAKWNNKVLTVPNGTKILVKVDDLPQGSNIKVQYLCDYCLTNTGEKMYTNYLKERKLIEKDCCYSCRSIKIKESNMINYGVESTNQLDEVLEKRHTTNLEKFGTKYPSQNKEVRNKIENTFIEKYGVNTPSKNQEIKDKTKTTNIVKYGAISPTLNDEVREKQINTLLDNYGVEYPQQSKEIKEKSLKSLYENGNAPCSRQQRYIHNLIGGELNFPHNNSLLDIAFPEEKIYFELDLGGHDLQVKFGNVTEDEFKEIEKRRWYALYRKGWKEIRMVSSKDKIPYDEKILELIKYAKEYLETGRHYIKFYLDECKVETSQFVKDYDFGELRWIYKND